MDGSGVAVFSPEDVAVGIFKPIAPVSTINVYPNPVKSVLKIDGKFDRVTVMNISGQMVKSVRTTNSVDVSNLLNGMYIIHAYDNDVMVGVSKFTKN